LDLKLNSPPGNMSCQRLIVFIFLTHPLFAVASMQNVVEYFGNRHNYHLNVIVGSHMGKMEFDTPFTLSGLNCIELTHNDSRFSKMFWLMPKHVNDTMAMLDCLEK